MVIHFAKRSALSKTTVGHYTLGAWELELSSHLFGPQTSDFWPSRDTSAPDARAETRAHRDASRDASALWPHHRYRWLPGGDFTPAFDRSKMPDAPANAIIIQGPCKSCCSPLASCCISADGGTLYGCVPLYQPQSGFDYILPCLCHTCLCPQQGCDPCPTHRSRDKKRSAWISNVAANLCGMCLQYSPSQLFL